MTKENGEYYQEPPVIERELDRLFDRGLLGQDGRTATGRYGAGSRFFHDWEYSCFNPDFRSGYGRNDGDIDRLTAGDRYIRASAAITKRWQYFVRKVLIDNVSIDDFMRRHPIYNRTVEEKAVLIMTLQDALDQIADAYEKMDKERKEHEK